MTQGEKAKAYDEAIERARSKIKNDKDHILYEDDVIEIFPELKESEDEKIRQNLHKLLCAEISIGTFEKYGLADDTVFDWLEKQKSAKWSEEDERILERLICVFNSYKNSQYKINRDKWEGLEINNVLCFLKSLKPNHWKPSEEQLTALKNAIIGKRGPLYDLYFDIEKL